MAGLDMLRIMNNLDYRPKYERDKCIKNSSPKASCDICHQVCSQDAITIGKKRIGISDSCDFCNECVAHCPTNALVDSGRKFLGNQEEIYLLCHKQSLEDDINSNIKVECLNFLSTKILLNIYSAGYREIHTKLDKCQDCERKSKLDEELARANRILEALDLKPIRVMDVEVEELMEKAQEASRVKKDTKVDRRNFFKYLAKDAVGKTYELAPPALRVQHWRSTTQILTRWQANSEKKLSLYSIDIDQERCIQCKACTKMCPQEVWQEDGEDLQFRPHLCNQCNLCKDICPTNAIEVEEHIRLTDEETSLHNTEKECADCGKEFKTALVESDHCPSCIWKRIKK